MKAKHLLFSSMFLSMGFAACTNEIEEFASQNQVEDYPGVELGKDFAISVNNSDFSADAETRAAFEQVGTNWVAAWGNDAEGNPDALGAAWFNKFVYAEDGKTVENPKDVYDALSEYGSNAKFVWQGGQTFQSEAISKLGAYVLYYPYNEGLTDNMQEIPVKKIPSTQTFDVKAQTAQVTENITAANVVVFGTSGDQAPAFTIKQIPNLYALSFYIADEALLSLANDIEITNVMLEVTDGSGNGLIYTDGIIEPSYTNITADTYNGVESADAMPEIKFEGRGKKTDRMMINVINDGDEEYHITEIGKEYITKPFFFSMLPVDKTGINKVSFKIIAKVGDRTKVFEKLVTDMSKSYISKMSKQGEVINLNVGLTHEGTIDGIYSVEQFVENWKANETNFNLATELDLSELTKDQVDFENVEKHVVFSGEKVTLPSIKGKYTFTNEVEIKGDATIERCEGGATCGCDEQYAFGQKATITGNLNTLGSNKVLVSTPITIEGNVTAEHIKFSKPATIGGNIEVSASAEFAQGVTATGGLIIAENAKATLGNHVSHIVKVANIEAKGDIKVKGVVTTGDINIEKKAEFEGAIKEAGNITLASTATAVFNSDVISAGEITANAAVTFNENVTAAKVIANMPVTFSKKAVVKGDIDANAKVVIDEAVVDGDVNAAAEVEFTTATIKGDVTANAASKLGTATIEGNLTATGVKVAATELTVGDITLAEKATLTAPTLKAKNIELDLMSVLTANTKFDVIEKLTAGGKVNAGEAAIEDLAIAYNVVVDLASAKVTKLDVNKTGTYFGTLNVENALEVTEGTNNGVINAATCTINGTFDQNATLNAAITVAKDAEKNINGILNVNTNMTVANITNNGTVNVAKDMTLKAAGKNNGIINVNGTLTEEGTLALTEESVIKLVKDAALTLINNTDKEGDVEVVNGCTFNGDTFLNTAANADIIYRWSGNNPSDETQKAYITEYYFIDAQLLEKHPKRLFLTDPEGTPKLTDVYVSGDLAFKLAGGEFNCGRTMHFIDNAKIKSSDNTELKLTLTGVITVYEGKTLTIDESVKLQSGTNITLKKNASLKGDQGGATVTQVNS